MREILIILILVLSVTLTSCSQSFEKEVEPLNEAYSADASETSTNSITIGQVHVSDANMLKFPVASFQNGTLFEMETLSKVLAVRDISIMYPEIKTADSAKNAIINDLIYDEIQKLYASFNPNHFEVSADVGYELETFNSMLLSIAYTGTVYGLGTPYPRSIFFTTNINVETGEIITLNDVININESFLRLIRSENAVYLIPEQKPAISEITDNTLILRLQNSDRTDSMETESDSDVFSYFTKDSLGISIGVIHAAGDHAEIELRYKYLE